MRPKSLSDFCGAHIFIIFHVYILYTAVGRFINMDGNNKVNDFCNNQTIIIKR